MDRAPSELIKFKSYFKYVREFVYDLEEDKRFFKKQLVT